MGNIQIPDFGTLLAPYIEAIPEADRPAFLAQLERTAAERYRMWAAELPKYKNQLLACADREDEIAERIERLFPVHTEVARKLINENITPAKDTYYNVFSQYSVLEQLYIQANAERQGAQAWRTIAQAIDDPLINKELELCSTIEEKSADYLDELLAQLKLN